MARVVGTYSSDLLRMAAVALAALVLATVLMHCFLFHRVVGPLYRMKGYLRRVRATGEPGRLSFREHDQFHDIAALLTQVLTLHIPQSRPRKRQRSRRETRPRTRREGTVDGPRRPAGDTGCCKPEPRWGQVGRCQRFDWRRRSCAGIARIPCIMQLLRYTKVSAREGGKKSRSQGLHPRGAGCRLDDRRCPGTFRFPGP